MCSLPEIADLTLKQLTLRTVMLLALLTGQRGHALRLKIGDIRMHHNKCVIVFSSKHKQTKPGAHTEPAEISAFTQNPKISLVGHLHVPGKNMTVADMLSRKPMKAEDSTQLSEDMGLHVNAITSLWPVSDAKLD